MQRLLKPLISIWAVAMLASCSPYAQPSASNAPAATMKAPGAPLDYTPGQNFTVALPKAATLDLVWIVPGSYTMGAPLSEANSADWDHPQTMVTISKGFWIGKMLVTQGQYQAVMGNNPSQFVDVGPDAPVETVSWDDAMTFCRKLTEQERAAGHLPQGYVFTLPTEAQWEYACRAGTTGPRYGNLDDIAWDNSKSDDPTHPVGQKQPNAFGLYDMLGNVWEWCSDWWADRLPGGKVTDPIGPDSGSYRVGRGGGWRDDAANCRSAYRFWFTPTFQYHHLGFRVALAPSR
jgi:formylglycine-generating enzyme required for sulfatase activity